MLAMSGGVDSSVAALLLQKQGYEVLGLTYITWQDYNTTNTTIVNKTVDEAMRVAKLLGIEHFVLDIRQEFKDSIIKYFSDEYVAGRTPNPCVFCNGLLKFPYLREFAIKHKCDFISTGHYASVVFNEGRYGIQKGIDPIKDQSYFLWRLNQEELSMLLLPLGSMMKSEIKELARQNNLEHYAEKRESHGICFIPDDDYRKFFEQQMPEVLMRIKPGKILSSQGESLGEHKGLAYYTIGQRKGINVAVGHPIFITKLKFDDNSIIMGEREELNRYSLIANDDKWMKFADMPENIVFHTKIRNINSGSPAILKRQDDKSLYVEFMQPVWGVTPGQSVVFYDGDQVAGGAFISE